MAEGSENMRGEDKITTKGGIIEMTEDMIRMKEGKIEMREYTSNTSEEIREMIAVRIELIVGMTERSCMSGMIEIIIITRTTEITETKEMKRRTEIRDLQVNTRIKMAFLEVMVVTKIETKAPKEMIKIIVAKGNCMLKRSVRERETTLMTTQKT